ncbi:MULTISPECIES: hypothetical protein [unclassified Nonomuraea]
MEYGELVARASAAAIEGWDFAALHGRVVEEPLRPAGPPLTRSGGAGGR